MKILKSSLIIVLLLLLLCTGIYAHTTATSNSIYFADEDVTIVFENNSSLDENKREFVANAIVYGSPVQSRAWCWLTGHSYVENMVIAITHKVSDSAPRCWEDIYAITTCENCDYYDERLTASSMAFCCPEE